MEELPQVLSGFRGCHILEEAGHWIQLERATVVNGLLIARWTACSGRGLSEFSIAQSISAEGHGRLEVCVRKACQSTKIEHTRRH
jgi:hypothetical protein